MQAKAEYAPYYKNSLLYLACVDSEKDMSSEERLLRAHDLGISALLGDTIYNFGELVRYLIHVAVMGGRIKCVCTAYAPHTRRVGRHATRVDQEASDDIQ